MSGQKNGDVVVGGEPRVDLLPPEVEEAKRVRRVRRTMITLLVLGVVLSAAAFGGVSYLALLAQQRLDAENARTADLLTQQQEYIEARTTAQRVETAKAALTVGASTEIDLAPFIREVTALLPANCAIITANGDAASPFDAYAQATVPLQPQRIATFNFSVRTTSLLDVQAWLLALQGVDGFTDAMPGTVKTEADGTLTASVTMHVDTGALSDRFAPETEDADSADTGSTDTEGSDE